MLKLLLIEDTHSEATAFVNRMQAQFGDDVEIEWKTNIRDALAFLESGGSVDQIWLDPSLPSLPEAGMPRAMAALRKYVDPGELKLLGDRSTSDKVRSLAESQQVEVFEKGDQSQIFGIVKTLLEKKSGGTVRIEQVRQEGAIATLQWRIEQIEKRLDSTLLEAQAAFKAFTTAISELKKQQEDDKGERAEAVKKVREGRNTAIASIAAAILTLATTLITVATPHLKDWLPYFFPRKDVNQPEKSQNSGK